MPAGGPAPSGPYPWEWSEPSIQLRRYEDEGLAVRFCRYDHRGRFRRSPMMVDATFVGGLGKSLSKTPRLRNLPKSLSG
jgi:hypothetical protein